MRRSMVTRRRAVPWGTAPAVLLTMVLVAGCGGSDGLDAAAGSSSSPTGAATAASPTDPAATPTTSATPSVSPTADPGSVAEAGVAGDFRLYDKAFTKALLKRSTHVTDLIRYTTPRQQADDRSRIETMHQRGIVFKGGLRNWVGPVTVAGSRASLVVCEKDDAGWYVYAASGKLVVPVKDRWVGYEVRALRRDGDWQFDRLTESKKISCKGAK